MPQHEVFIDLNHYRLMHGPIMVSFDITQRCNLRCVHCFNNSGDQAPNADMPRDTKLAIARQVAEMHPFNVCLCGSECLCGPELFEIMDILQPHVAKLSMVSNGWLMSVKWRSSWLNMALIWHRSASMAPMPGSTTASAVSWAPLNGRRRQCAT